MPQPHATGAVLSLSRISKSFGEKQAVSELDLEIQRGAIFGLLGQNGAGKSTTIRMALNIYVPDSGQVRIFGQPHAPGVMDRVGYLPEERGLYTKMKVVDLLVYTANIKGIPVSDARKRVDRWLERVELPGVRDKKPVELSKGMQQKIQFIATVMHEPELIVLDEPFSGLDPVNLGVLKDLVLELRGKGATIIFSTHIMEQAERLCDAICLIHAGRSILNDTVTSIKEREGRNTIALAFDGDGSFLRQHRMVANVDSYPSYVELWLSDGADPQALLGEIASRVRVRRFEIVAPSLHDIFIRHVRQASAQQPEPEVARA